MQKCIMSSCIEGDYMNKPVIFVEDNSAFQIVFRVQKILHRIKRSTLNDAFMLEVFACKTHAELMGIVAQYATVKYVMKNKNMGLNNKKNSMRTENDEHDQDIDNEDSNDGDIIK